MQCRTATHAVVAVLVVAFHNMWWIQPRLKEIYTDAVTKKAGTTLHKETTIGIAAIGKHPAHLGKQKHAALVDGEFGNAAFAANDFAIHGGDALSENRDTVTLDLVTENEIGICRQQPVGSGLVDKTATQVIRDAV